MQSSVRFIFVKVVFATMIIGAFYCGFVESSCYALPDYLDRPINNSITAINLLIDDLHDKIKVKSELTIPTLKSMSRGLDHGGPIEEMIKVGVYVFKRFLSEVDSRTNLLLSQAMEHMESASKSVQNELDETLTPCEQDKLGKSIDDLLQRIEPEIENLRVHSNDKQWVLYYRVCDILTALHNTKLKSEEEYTKRLEVIMEYGGSRCIRIENENAMEQEYILAEFAKEMRQIVLKALRTHADEDKQDL